MQKQKSYHHSVTENGDIQGYEGRYSVTPDGEIWSFITRRYLKPALTSRGYPAVRLYKIHSQRGKTKCVHRLVAEMFLQNPENKEQINHKDGNKENNSIDNLEWCTCSENHKHAFRTKIRIPSANQKAATRKLSFMEALYVRKVYVRGKITQKFLGDKFCVDHKTISNIILNKTYLEA